MKIDPELQAQVDAQLIEQGAYATLELLINTGRLLYADYERWRRGEVELLDEVLMGSPKKIRAQAEDAAAYARSIGLVEQAQEFHRWGAQDSKPLRTSADQHLARLIAARFAPAQATPQMDLFFDNPVVALTNGIAQALATHNLGEAQRQLDRLYAQAPNHADLAAFDRLTSALESLDRPIVSPEESLAFLLDITPTAKRLLGGRFRDLLTPMWRRLAEALNDQPYSSATPNLHRSFALAQAQDWSGAIDCIRAEPGWYSHASLCLRLAQAGFYRQQRVDALTAWFHLCWLHPIARSKKTPALLLLGRNSRTATIRSSTTRPTFATFRRGCCFVNRVWRCSYRPICRPERRLAKCITARSTAGFMHVVRHAKTKSWRFAKPSKTAARSCSTHSSVPYPRKRVAGPKKGLARTQGLAKARMKIRVNRRYRSGRAACRGVPCAPSATGSA
jgi:hypothetical protein